MSMVDCNGCGGAIGVFCVCGTSANRQESAVRAAIA